MTKLDELETKGCCGIKGLFDESVIRESIAVTNRALKEISADHREDNKSQGSLVPMAEYPGYSKIIAYPKLIETLEKEFNFTDVRFSSGYLISKPPKSPPLFWHQDWWGWGHPLSYKPFIAQIAVFVYLTETTVENGCLKYIPGSHRQKHHFHNAQNAHGEDLAKVKNPSDPLFGKLADEEQVMVKLGDAVICDARLMHASNANRSASERSSLTLWYHPNWSEQPDSFKAIVKKLYDREDDNTSDTDAGGLSLDQWPKKDHERIQHLIPLVDKDAAREPWNRTPNF